MEYLSEKMSKVDKYLTTLHADMDRFIHDLKMKVKDSVQSVVDNNMKDLHDDMWNEITTQVQSRYEDVKTEPNYDAHLQQEIKRILDETAVTANSDIMTTFHTTMLPKILQTIKLRSNDILQPIDIYLNDMQTEIDDTEIKVTNFLTVTKDTKTNIEANITNVHALQSDINQQDTEIDAMKIQLYLLKTDKDMLLNDLTATKDNAQTVQTQTNNIQDDLDKHNTIIQDHYSFMADVETFMRDYKLDDVDALKEHIRTSNNTAKHGENNRHNSDDDKSTTENEHSYIPMLNSIYEDVIRKFERFLKHDISLKDTSQGSIALFYKDLQTIGEMYHIYLIPFDAIAYDKPLYMKNVVTTPIFVQRMSSHLFYKLKQPGVLPSETQRFQSLIQSHASTSDGLSLLTQILRPYLPALQDGIELPIPTWDNSQGDVFLVHTGLVNYYRQESSLGRHYTPMEQSKKFLKIRMSSGTAYVEPATYNHRKLEEMGGRKETPHDNLLLTNIANTLDINVRKLHQTSGIEDTDIKPLIKKTVGNHNPEEAITPSPHVPPDTSRPPSHPNPTVF